MNLPCISCVLQPASVTIKSSIVSELSSRMSGLCLTVTAQQTDLHNWILACRSSGGISRSTSEVKVTGQIWGHQFKNKHFWSAFSVVVIICIKSNVFCLEQDIPVNKLHQSVEFSLNFISYDLHFHFWHFT